MRCPSLALLAALAVACDAPTDPAGVQPRAPDPTLDQTGVITQVQGDRTAFQQSVMRSIAERQAAGLPSPRATYEYHEAQIGAPLLRAAGATEPPTTITASTVIAFDNPGQAGLEVWPALVVKGEVPEGAEGFVKEGDYTQLVLEQIAAQYPDAWSGVSYETGPRTYTVTESIVQEATTAPPALGLLGLERPAALTSADGLLLGFTVLGPNIDYHVEWDLSVCIIWFFGCQVEWEIFDFWAGLVLDWTIATRLPLDVRVTSDDPVLEGSTFTPTTAATGQDWDVAAYEAAGVAPVEGNEFALEFVLKAGVFVEISYVDVVDLGVDIDVSSGASFTTPLGPGQTITLPSVNIPVWGVDAGVASFDLGVSLTPNAGSDKLTAGWLASAQGAGSGEVTYTTSDVDIPLGAVEATDGPGNAVVELSAFQYYFNQFVLDLGAFIYLQVLSWDHTWVIPVIDFDLSALTGGLYVGVHEGTPGALDLSIPIENVAPTAAISRAGTRVLSGQPAFLGVTGQAFAFTGQATDPGEDDLTLRWNWGDGPPVPDVSTTYPVPHDVSETQSHAFSQACVYQVGFSATDDDAAVGADQVMAVVGGAPGAAARLEGYWQHQLGRMGATDFDDGTLSCYLAIVAAMSRVFGEVRDVSDFAAAHTVVRLGQNARDPLAQLDRELLVVWLNFANGALGYDQLVDTDADGVGDTPFAEALAVAEGLRLEPLPNEREIRELTRMLHQISVRATS